MQTEQAMLMRGSRMLTTIRTCLSFFSRQGRLRWAGLIPLTLVSAALESLGALAIFFIVTLLTEPDGATRSPLAADLLAWLEESTGLQQLPLLLLLVTAFFVAKNTMLGVTTAAQHWISTREMSRLSGRLLEGYLRLPYSFHLKRNSSEMIQASIQATDILRQAMSSLIIIATETMLATAVLIVLCLVTPWISLLTCLALVGLMTAILQLLNLRMRHWGAESYQVETDVVRQLQESLGGVKEIKTSGKEQFFTGAFADSQRRRAQLMFRQATFMQLPRLVIETSFVLIMLAIAVPLSQSESGENTLAVLALFAYAGFRLMPSIHRITDNFNILRWASEPIQSLRRDFFDVGSEAPSRSEARRPLTFSRSLTFQNVSYLYEGTETPAVRNLNFSLGRNDLVGIVGRTGSGKSTVIHLLMGLLVPTSGEILLDGEPLDSTFRSWRQKIGYVAQSPFLLDDTLSRNIAFGIQDPEISLEKVRRSVALAQLEPLVDRLPSGLETRVGERGVRLSGGEVQRIAIARALYREPEILVFDEATSALDLKTEEELARAIELLSGDRTVIIVAHRLTTVRQCEQLILLSDGKVAGTGTFSELAAANAEFQEMVALSESDNPGGVRQ